MAKLKTMTVAELRELLNGVEDDVLVGFEMPSNDYWRTVLFGTIRKAEVVTVKWSEYHRQHMVHGDDTKSDNNAPSVLILS